MRRSIASSDLRLLRLSVLRVDHIFIWVSRRTIVVAEARTRHGARGRIPDDKGLGRHATLSEVSDREVIRVAMICIVSTVVSPGEATTCGDSLESSILQVQGSLRKQRIGDHLDARE